MLNTRSAHRGGTDMSDFTMTIGGDQRPAEKTFGVINPATGEVHAQAPDCSREQLDEAMEAASKAYIDWRTNEDVRREALRNAANVMFGSGGELAPILTKEQGQPPSQANIECLGA